MLINSGDDVPAATLARALFDESMPWAWVDEEPERRSAFLGDAARASALIAEAADVQGIDAGQFFGPLVAAQLLPAAEGAGTFPRGFEDSMDWMPDSGMHYLQYRVLSQHVHSSLLSAASTAVEMACALENSRALPVAARLTVIRNAVASIALVFDFTKEGLSWPGAPLLNFAVIAAAVRIAEITLPFAPAGA